MGNPRRASPFRLFAASCEPRPWLITDAVRFVLRRRSRKGGGGAEAHCGKEMVAEKECVCERKRARELGDIISASGRAGDHLKGFKDF